MIKKIVWMYWDRGFKQAPDLVKVCVESWQRCNPNWTMNMLDNENLSVFIDMSEIRKLNPRLIVQAFADVLRWKLLRDHGGVWVDATLYCCRPLDDWLAAEVTPEGFFAFRSPHTYLYHSWFLVGGAGSSLVQEMVRELDRFMIEFGGYRYYWDYRGLWRIYHQIENLIGHYNYELWRSYLFRKYLKATPYFFQNYLTGHVLSRFPQARKDFESLKITYGEDPHAIQTLTAHGQSSDLSKFLEYISGPCPVQKLTNKRFSDEWKDSGVLGLLNRYGRR